VRPAAAVLVLGTALATGVPAAWALTRPPAAVGPPIVAELASTPASPTPAPPTQATSPASPTPASPTPASPTAASPTAASPAAASPTPATPVPELPAPARVAVPDLGIDAPVDGVGVAADGQMAIPGQVDRVGWYRFGPVPGGAGNAVLAGHVDDAVQGLGALSGLRQVAVGAEVVVTDATGTASRWRVVSRELIDKQALPLAEIFRREGPPRLLLVTCGGTFLPELRSYEDNVVVVAEPVP
jgi:sortase (surface protein transpeptidase)